MLLDSGQIIFNLRFQGLNSKIMKKFLHGSIDFLNVNII